MEGMGVMWWHLISLHGVLEYLRSKGRTIIFLVGDGRGV